MSNALDGYSNILQPVLMSLIRNIPKKLPKVSNQAPLGTSGEKRARVQTMIDPADADVLKLVAKKARVSVSVLTSAMLEAQLSVIRQLLADDEPTKMKAMDAAVVAEQRFMEVLEAASLNTEPARDWIEEQTLRR